MTNKTILKASQCVNIVVSIAIERGGKVLMVEEAKKGIKGLWNFPSGKVNMGENLIKTAEREGLEETGYKIKITDLCFVDHYMWDDNTGATFRFNFWGKIIGKQQIKKLAKDVLSIRWMDAKELKQIMQAKKLRGQYTERMLKAVLEGQKSELKTINSLVGK